MLNLKAIVMGIVLVTFLSSAAASENDISAQEIIEQSDQIRNPAGSFLMDVQITEYDSGRSGEKMRVRVLSKPETGSGMFRTLVEIAEPRRDRGKLILRNSQDLWFFDPSSKASVRISPQQRLLGQVFQW